MNALGFIETKGLLAVIEGADAMLKAADVALLEKNLAGGGLVSVTVTGEVSAVQAAVEAGTAAISRIAGAELVSRHVIARPYEELSRIISTTVPMMEDEEISEETATEFLPEEAHEEPVPVEDGKAETEAGPVQQSTPEKKPADETPKFRIAELRKMKINRIRQIARSLRGISLTPDEVKNATKKALIDAIINVTRQIEE
ncbi:BMC domain-containing protein [Maridesulfovibrio sp.]|uniref:BMC domain-containing protein n=1 Tax=Maridesulfovibrio sp. TaxID=2795000 RepID=UPI002A189F5F|nr:BMC domain-containing protein [Maridesulfovibrio sp.]